MSKLSTRLLSAFLCLFLVLPLFHVAAAADGVTVTIYHTNDIHGYAEQVENQETGVVTQLGLDRVAALKAATENALLVDAGDFSQGHVFANFFDGRSVVEVMNEAGYDIAALGNHEFDYDIATLERNIGIAGFDLLSANVIIDEAHSAEYPNLSTMPLYSLQEVAGKKIVFFSVNTPELDSVANPKTKEEAGIRVRTDLAALSEELVATIREDVPDVDAIVAITHTGFGEGNRETSRDVAAVEGIDVVIDGHDHQLRLGDMAQTVNGTLVVSTGTAMTALGKLELTFTGSALEITSSDAFDEARDLEPHAATAAVTGRWNGELEALKTTVVFESEVNLWGGNLDGYTADDEKVVASIARRGATNIGELYNNARIWRARNWLGENADSPLYDQLGLRGDMPVVSLSVGGGLRGSTRAGEVTLDELMGVYPYAFGTSQDTYVLITPQVLYLLVEHGVNIFSGQDTATGMLEADGSIHGRFPNPGGYAYVYDITRQKSGEYDAENLAMPDMTGSRVLSITLDDGTGLDREDNETSILLVTGVMEIAGGDGYWMLGALNDADNYGGYQYIPEIATLPGSTGEVVIEYVNAVHGGVLPAREYGIVNGRITRVNDPYTGTGYEAKLTVTADGETLLDGVEFAVYVDGEAQAMSSSAEGVITLALANGPHEVRLINADTGYDSGTVYLDNYSGLHNAVLVNTPGELPPAGMPVQHETSTPVETSPAPAPAPANASQTSMAAKAGIILAIGAIAICVFLYTKKKRGS